MKEIANTLGISPRTLETYRTRGMEKLGLKSRAELVRYALQRGWLKND
jgi:DNA-binding CsgD family transcriptional regulator